MISLLLAAMLFIQNIPALSIENGIIAGIVRNAAGAPAAGVRVAAMVRPESPGDTPSALASLGETDDTGRYRLERIPPGQYYIVAGRVDLPTYYPGTLERDNGMTIAISAGDAISAIDFVMLDASVRLTPSTSAPSRRNPALIPVNIGLEGGGKVPLFGPAGFLSVRLTRIQDGGGEVTLPVNRSGVNDRPIGPGTYRVTVENLPDGYTVRSLLYGSTDLTTGTLNVPVANTTLSFANVGSGVPTTVAELQQYVTQTPASPTPSLFALLAAPATPHVTSGVRVSGRLKDGITRGVYLSGTPGVLYSDGTFEFRGVQPGRHVLVAMDTRSSSPQQGASIVVENRDLEGVELSDVAVVPLHLRSAQPGGTGTYAPGIVPLASLRGRAVEEGTRQPFSAGTVSIIGDSIARYSIGADGGFLIPQLLPGSYSLEVNLYSVGIINRTVVIDDKDVTIEITAK